MHGCKSVGLLSHEPIREDIANLHPFIKKWTSPIPQQSIKHKSSIVCTSQLKEIMMSLVESQNEHQDIFIDLFEGLLESEAIRTFKNNSFLQKLSYSKSEHLGVHDIKIIDNTPHLKRWRYELSITGWLKILRALLNISGPGARATLAHILGMKMEYLTSVGTPQTRVAESKGDMYVTDVVPSYIIARCGVFQRLN